MVSSLFKASESGDVSKTTEALKDATPVDIEIKDHTGTTPLIVAVKNGHLEVVKMLLAAGADPLNPSSQGPPASLTSDPEILSLLSQSTPRPSAGLPPYASPYGHPHHHQHQPPYLGGGPNGAGGEMYFSGGGYSPYPYGMYGMGPPPPLMGGMGYPGGPHPHMMQQQQVVPAGEEQQGGAREAEQKERVEGPEGEAGSIPPPDISKTIPCKFFPQCKYGTECAFQHPPQPFNNLPPPPPLLPMYPQHDYNMPPFAPPFYQFPPNFYPGPPGSMPMAPPQMMSPHPSQYRPHRYQQQNMPDFNENAFVVVPPPMQPPPVFSPSALAPPFSPSVVAPAQQASSSTFPSPSIETFVPSLVESTQASTQSSDDPSSSSVAEPRSSKDLELASSLAPALSPQTPSPTAAGGVRESSSNASVSGPRRFGPFGGPASGFKKWATGKAAVKWTGGNAPPCSFFLNNRCRNSELCRFPHIRPDGVDCRLPGVIDGTIAAAPISVIPKSTRPPTLFSSERDTSETGLESSLESLKTEITEASSSAAPASSSPSLSTDASSFVPRAPSAFTPAFVPKSGSNAFIVQPQAANRPSFPFAPMHHYPHGLPRSSPNTRPTSPSTSTFAQMTQQQQLAAMRNPRSISAAPTSRRSDAAFSSDDFPALGASSSISSTTGRGKELGGSALNGWKKILSTPAPGAEAAKSNPVEPAKVDRQAESSSSGSGEVINASDASDDDAVIVNATRAAPSAQNGRPFPRAPSSSLAVALRA